MRVRAGSFRVKLPDRGVELALLDFGGEGPLALLHHANGFCAALWEPVALELAAHRFRVLALDARGHGDSSVPAPPDGYGWIAFTDDLVALVERLRELGFGERIAYGIGHSFGGTMMTMAAARSPERFERLALVDPVLFPREGLWEPPPGFQRPPIEELARERRRNYPSRAALLERWARPEHAFAAWHPRARELYAAEGFRDLADGSVELKCAPEVEAAVFANNRTVDAFAAAPEVRAPVLLLWAQRGNFPRTVYEAFVARLRRGRLEDIDGGHLVVMEDPGRVARHLLRFAE